MAYKTTMRMENQPRSGMALGGMGSGWFELRQNGRFYNWSIFNNEPYGTG
jgi:non-lysosomal glucosylceramidase